MQVNDLTDKKFGRLYVVSRAENNVYGKAQWLCQCECGETRIVIGTKLKSGHTSSCGCLQKERIDEARVKHGHYYTRLHEVWAGMKKRCNNPNSHAYEHYGGRGITVCVEWNDFVVFREWALENGYEDHLTIDRIDNDGNYEPSNCEFVTMKQQMHNRRKFRNNTSGVSGVTLNKKTNKWRVVIGVNGKKKHVGCFTTKEEAIQARLDAEKLYWQSRN